MLLSRHRTHSYLYIRIFISLKEEVAADLALPQLFLFFHQFYWDIANWANPIRLVVFFRFGSFGRSSVKRDSNIHHKNLTSAFLLERLERSGREGSSEPMDEPLGVDELSLSEQPADGESGYRGMKSDR